MQENPSHQVGHAVPTKRTSRRAIVSWTMKLAGGAALATTVPGFQWVQLAAAQDDEIILTAAASEVGAKPGSAYATGAAANAAADHEFGALTEAASVGSGSGAGPGDSTGSGAGGDGGGGGAGTGGGGGMGG